MNIQSSLDGLKSLLGVPPAATPAPQQATSTTAATSSALNSDRATLSCAGCDVSLTANDSDVRMDKVTSIQSALASGTYNVPASAVASKMVDSMMGENQ
jgi:negative regulator of flagellin synthesis FlgM